MQEVLKRSPLTDKRVERLLLATDRLLEEQGKVLNELHRLSKMDSGFLTSIESPQKSIHGRFPFLHLNIATCVYDTYNRSLALEDTC